MNSSYFISTFLILSFTTEFIASKLQLYVPEGIALFSCQWNVFWPTIAIVIAAFLQNTVAINIAVVFDGKW